MDYLLDLLDVLVEKPEGVGLVSMRPATVSSMAFSRASISTPPRLSDGMVTVWKPARTLDAGLVP